MIGRRFGRLTVLALDEQRMIDERERQKTAMENFIQKHIGYVNAIVEPLKALEMIL